MRLALDCSAYKPGGVIGPMRSFEAGGAARARGEGSSNSYFQFLFC